jgi:Ser/Thr protein kinase RdoA (MazF antagonist)
MPNEPEAALPDFSHLTPDIVLHLVERSLDRRCSNLCRPLTSYINRVYDVEMDDGSWVVAKFYRPGRWSRDALQDEQEFLFELAEREIPVIAPARGADGAFLQEHHGMYYAVFPKKGGRACDEPTDREWLELGRLLARVHSVGALHAPRDRIEIGPRQSTTAHVRFILEHDFLRPGLRSEYEAATRDLLDLVSPLFEEVEKIRIHGDAHGNNIIRRPGEPLTLIDFDDMAVGPPVQDLWMLLPGHLRQSLAELGLLLEGYETFRAFDRGTLRLIEPLRAMRFIHFTAWCARQKADGGFARLAPDWGAESFWKKEIHDLRQQHQEIVDSLEAPLPPL